MPTLPGTPTEPRQATTRKSAVAPDVLQAIEAERTRRAALKMIDAEEARRAPSIAGGVARSFAQGVTFGFADEAEAAGRAAWDVTSRSFGFADEADAAIRSLWARGEDESFAAAARRRP